jgi:hypothetical protein
MKRFLAEEAVSVCIFAMVKHCWTITDE